MARKDKISYKAIKKSLENMKDKIEEIESNFEDKVCEHPKESIGIAFGSGALVGAIVASLMRRK